MNEQILALLELHWATTKINRVHQLIQNNLVGEIFQSTGLKKTHYNPISGEYTPNTLRVRAHTDFVIVTMDNEFRIFEDKRKDVIDKIGEILGLEHSHTSPEIDGTRLFYKTGLKGKGDQIEN